MHTIYLHGALGSAAQWQVFVEEGRPDKHVLDLPGHGLGGSDYEGAFSIEAFAQFVLDYMDARGIEQADIVGYSMGGYVGAYLAARQPQRLRRLLTLATKWQWDPATAEREVRGLNADKIAEKLPAFAYSLAARHGATYWRLLLERTAGLLWAMGERNPLQLQDLQAIEQPCRLCVGDRDAMVSIEETAATYRLLPQGSMLVLPGTPHPLERVSPERLRGEWDLFLGG